MRRLILLLGVVFAAYVIGSNTETAADVSGVPNLPTYPCIGKVGLAAIVPYVYLDCPTEANGTHYHCQEGGPLISGGAFTATNGFGLGGLGSVGLVFGDCYWAWPDNTYGPAPNPPGAWRNFLVPAPVPVEHTAAPQPYDQTLDVAPPPVGASDVPPQVIPPPTVASPTMTAPIMPGQSQETLPPPAAPGERVPPGQGVVPPVSPKNLNPAVPDPGSLKPRGN